MLSAQGVRKSYSGREVLSGVDVELLPGTVTRVQAANGSGKSTLLRVLAGAALPDAGTVSRGTASVGYVPDRWVPPPGFSARSFLRLMSAAEGRPDHRVDAVLERLDVRPDTRTRLTTLSKGNAQKVLCAHAFGRSRGILILDEPTTGLDAAATAVLKEMIEEARHEGAVVVLVDHGTLPLEPNRVLTLQDGSLEERLPETVPRASVVIDKRADLRALAATFEVSGGGSADWTVVCCETEVESILRIALDSRWTIRAVTNPAGAQ